MAFNLRGAHARIVGPAEESDDVPCTAHKSAPFALGSAPVCTTARNIARRAAPPRDFARRMFPKRCADTAVLPSCSDTCMPTRRTNLRCPGRTSG
jgi:hypothetical protein